MEIRSQHKLSCHCGAIELELSLPDGLDDPRRCDCSMCRRRGAIVATAAFDQVRLTRGEDVIGMYQFKTMTAKHYFCKNCGIYTHHQRCSNPAQFSFNIGCLEGVNPYELGEVPVYDGINHMADRDNKYRHTDYRE